MSAIFDSITEPPANRIAAGLMRIGHALRSRSWVEGGRYGLTPTQAQILTLLERAIAGTRPSSLADKMQVSRATLSDATAALVRKGLVAREKDPKDRRAAILSLTDQGKTAAIEAAGFPSFLVQAIAELPEQQQIDLLRGIIGTIRSLQERGEISPARLCITCRHFRANVYDDPVEPHHCALVDAQFGDRHLRVDCPEQSPAPPGQEEQAWAGFLSRKRNGNGHGKG